MKTSTERKILPYKREGHLPVKREEIEPLGLLRREIDRLFENFTLGFTLEPFRTLEERIVERFRQFTPVVDVTETDKNLNVNVELPGMDEKDIKLSVTDGHLMIRGEKKEEKEEKKKGFYRTERTFGEFSRVIPLPTGVDTKRVSSVFKKGLLRITIPKTKETRTTG